ncbi:translation initiation factor IF-3 [Bacillus rossius redtenbacheri]|uniref:translation initiation factor IF-3 n=1 Tax=Bacillus rossius redtenbacheri TaxID=93214 RepID=UPI002FDD9A97
MALNIYKLFVCYLVRPPGCLRNRVMPNIIRFTDNFRCEKPLSVYLFSSLTGNNVESAPPKPKKKGLVEPKITLLGTEGEVVGVTTLAEAHKISKRRDLRLVKTVDFDSKTGRPVYQLLTGAKFFEEEKKQRQLLKSNKKDVGFKGEKILSLSSKISEHDLKSKLNKMLEWLVKRYEVRVAITAEPHNVGLAEQVYESLVKGIKTEGRIVQKRLKGSEIRFQVLPPKLDTKNSTNTAEVSDADT